jgi:preprotein translocase subunit SecA
MDYLRQGIHLRGYAQKTPKQQHQREAFELFSAMLDSIKEEVVGTLAKLQIQAPERVAEMAHAPAPPLPHFEFRHEEFHGLADPDEDADLARGEDAGGVAAAPFVRDGRKVGRNEPCPCGSGKKYKQCHGKAD